MTNFPWRFYTLLLRKRVAMPHGTSRLYNLVSVSMVLHNLVPAALGRVYPVETSTSLYNLYIIPTCCHRNKGEVEYICMYVCMYVYNGS